MDPLNTNQVPPVVPPISEKKIGPVVGAVIIVVLLIIAAVYFWSRTLNNRALDYSNQEQSESLDYIETTTTSTTTVKTEQESEIDNETGTAELDSLNELEF